MHALDRPDEVARLTSFEKELCACNSYCQGDNKPPMHATTEFDNLGHSRDEFLYLEGDLSFCVAVVTSTEPTKVVWMMCRGAQWWGVQLASRFAIAA